MDESDLMFGLQLLMGRVLGTANTPEDKGLKLESHLYKPGDTPPMLAVGSDLTGKGIQRERCYSTRLFLSNQVFFFAV